jgi:hypothetical protein
MLESSGKPVSTVFPRCFPKKDVRSITAAVVLHGGGNLGKTCFSAVSLLFPQGRPFISQQQ